MNTINPLRQQLMMPKISLILIRGIQLISKTAMKLMAINQKMNLRKIKKRKTLKIMIISDLVLPFPQMTFQINSVAHVTIHNKGVENNNRRVKLMMIQKLQIIIILLMRLLIKMRMMELKIVLMTSMVAKKKHYQNKFKRKKINRNHLIKMMDLLNSKKNKWQILMRHKL